MDSSWLVTSILGGIILYLVYFITTVNKKFWDKRGVVSVFSLPIVGVMSSVFIKKKGLSEVLSDIYHKLEGERFGGYFHFTSPALMIRDPELINQILIKDFIHFEDRSLEWKRPTDLFSMGVSNLTGDEWRTARHKLTPTFTSGKLKTMFGHINRCSDDVVAHIRDRMDDDINAKELSLKYIINVIASVAFGLQIDTLKDGNDNEFYRVSSKFFAPSTTLLLKAVVAMSFPRLRDYFNFKIIEDDVDKFFRKLTTDVIKYRESTSTKRNDFLQLMLEQREKERKILSNGGVPMIQSEEAEDPDDKEILDQLKNTPISADLKNGSTEIFTDDFIAAQTFLFVSGGSETTATVLSFVLYELAINEEYQKRAQKEIDNVLANSEFNYQAMKRMTYLEQFINESMRYHSFTGAIMRMCTKNYKIPETDVTIEKGTVIFIPIGSIHKDPQFFPEPEVFNPDRFEDMNAIQKGTFFNFGDGPRICIAKRLAILEMKIYISKILLNYDIVLSDKTKLPLKPIKNTFILAIEGGLWVKFRQRRT